MSKPYLEVTYRKGKPFAAYLYLDRRSGDVAARSERRGDFVVDYAGDGRAIGIELLRLTGIELPALNAALAAVRGASLVSEDIAPLTAA